MKLTGLLQLVEAVYNPKTKQPEEVPTGTFYGLGGKEDYKTSYSQPQFGPGRAYYDPKYSLGTDKPYYLDPKSGRFVLNVSKTKREVPQDESMEMASQAFKNKYRPYT
jgi:hypothetical protein